MRIEVLRLKDYRNITVLELVPEPNTNIIYGNNAQGKTNLIESIFLLTGQRSFRQSRESDFIRFGQKTTRIEANFWSQNREQTAVLQIEKGKKRAFLNGIEIQPSELTGNFFAVVFSPLELALIQDGPAQRRAFLDNAISQVMPRYMHTLAAFNRVLIQRNRLLTEVNRHPHMEDLLATWDKSFSKLSYSIIHARRRYIARLASKVNEIYHDISGGLEACSIFYQCSIPGDLQELEISSQAGEQLIFEQLSLSRREDFRMGYTTIGPQRDDLELMIGGLSARTFGSQGQQRSCALTLKLAESALIEEITGEQPIILLDDVLSELDKNRREYFLSGIHKGQIFITCCDRKGFQGIGSSTILRMQGGIIKKMKKAKLASSNRERTK